MDRSIEEQKKRLGVYWWLYLYAWVCYMGDETEFNRRIELRIFKPLKHLNGDFSRISVRNYFLTIHNQTTYENARSEPEVYNHMLIPYKVVFVDPIDLVVSDEFNFSLPSKFIEKKLDIESEKRMGEYCLCKPYELKLGDIIYYHGPVVDVDIK